MKTNEMIYCCHYLPITNKSSVEYLQFHKNNKPGCFSIQLKLKLTEFSLFIMHLHAHAISINILCMEFLEFYILLK